MWSSWLMNQIYSIIINPSPPTTLIVSRAPLSQRHTRTPTLHKTPAGWREWGSVTWSSDEHHLHHKENVTVTHPTTLSSEVHTVPPQDRTKGTRRRVILAPVRDHVLSLEPGGEPVLVSLGLKGHMPRSVVWWSLLVPAGPNIPAHCRAIHGHARIETDGKTGEWGRSVCCGLVQRCPGSVGGGESGLSTTHGASGDSYNVKLHRFTPLYMACHADRHSS